MTYPVTRMASVLEAAGCTNAPAGAVALLRDQVIVQSLHSVLRNLPDAGTPMTAGERAEWVHRFELWVDTYLPVSASAYDRSEETL